MSKQHGLLDLPNEILRDHILSQIEQHDLFWKIGLVCKRLLQIVFDMNKEIVIYKKEVFKNRRSLQKRQSLSRPSYLMKFHKDSFFCNGKPRIQRVKLIVAHSHFPAFLTNLAHNGFI